MEFDMTIVIAQIVNFVILIWLLIRFLYRPIMNTIDAREQAVKNRLEDARQRQQQAEEQIATYRKKEDELEKAREKFLEDAREEASGVRRQLLDQAAAEAESAKRRFADMLVAEREEMESTLQEELVRHVSQVTGALIRDMAGRTLEDGLIDAFEKELKSDKITWSKSAGEPVRIRLSFDPDDAQKERLRKVVAQSMSSPEETGETPGNTEFVLDPELVLGIEIEHNGSIVTWSAESYIRRLESRAIDSLTDIDETIDQAMDKPTEVTGHA